MTLSNNQRKKMAAAAHNAGSKNSPLTETDISDAKRDAITKQIEDADKLGTRERHDRMYEIAAHNLLKGRQGGCCNVTQCQKPDSAVHYNNGTHAWYCRSCALDIHSANRFDDFVLFDDLANI